MDESATKQRSRIVLFGDRVTEEDVEVMPNRTRMFGALEDQDWLEEFCHTVKVSVIRPKRS